VTEWLAIDDPHSPAHAAALIRAGGLIILPTDTVYGVGADPWQPEAVAALYAAKGRPPDKAIPLLLADPADMDQVTAHIPEAARQLAAAFWPGPLTIAVPKRPDLPEIVSALPTVGLRIPDHAGARAVIRACGGVLAATSANRSGEPSPVTAQEAAHALGEAVALVLDGGPCPGGMSSTVVTWEGDRLRVVRAGPVSEAALRAALG
jgi:L-threonylcarbamoyladenylate synthase